jgi:hypothetical protein
LAAPPALAQTNITVTFTYPTPPVGTQDDDGGPFDLQSLDYHLVQPSATSLLIGTEYDPALPITAQLTACPVTTNASFQTLAPTGFEGVSQLFVAWNLGEATSDLGEIDNLRFTIPH